MGGGPSSSESPAGLGRGSSPGAGSGPLQEGPEIPASWEVSAKEGLGDGLSFSSNEASSSYAKGGPWQSLKAALGSAASQSSPPHG